MKKQLFLFLANFVSLSLIAQTIVSVNNPSSVNRFKKFEITAQISGWTGNPDDPNNIEVWADVVTPSGSTIYVPAFYFQDYSVNNTTQQVTASGQPSWKVRYAPTEQGTHTFVLKAKMGSNTTLFATKTFTVSAPIAGSKGFIRIHSTNKKYFYWDYSNTTHFINGINLFQQPLLAPPKTTDSWTGRLLEDNLYSPSEVYSVHKQLQQLYDTLSIHGGNALRIRMDSWWMNLEVDPNFRNVPGFSIGQYDSRNAFIIDKIVERVESDQLAFMITEWNTNYNAPAISSQYTIDENTDLIKRKLRYVIARWGYSPSFFTHEYFNEINNPFSAPINVATSTFWQGITQWLRNLDYRDTPINNTKDNIDYSDFHNYIPPPFTKSFIMDSKSNYDAQSTKPFIWGEYGFNDNTYMTNDTKGLVLHEGIWANLMSHRSGALVWHIHQQLLTNSNASKVFTPINNYLQTENLVSRTWSQAAFTNLSGPGGLITRGMIGDNQVAFLWFVRTPANEITDRTAANGNTYSVSSVTNGTYKVEWWDSFKGIILSTQTNLTASAGKLNLNVPNGVTRDIVAKVVYTGATGGQDYSLEAESLTSTGDGVVASDVASSNGAYVYVVGLNKSVTFTVPNISAGQYRIKYQYRTFLNSGIVQFKTDGILQGATLDQYTGVGGQFLIADQGLKNLGGNHSFTYTITGKNANSSGYKVSIDKIILEYVGPQSLVLTTDGSLSRLAEEAQVGKEQLEGFKIYPNPAGSLLKISYPGESTFTLYDAVGKEVGSRHSQDGNAEFDVTQLSQGLYLLRVNSGEEVKTHKILIVR